MKSLFIFCAMLFITPLASVAFADEQIAPAGDSIRAAVKETRRIEIDIKGMCNSYNRAQSEYNEFNSPNSGSHTEAGRIAAMQQRQEMYGSQVTANYQGLPADSKFIEINSST